MKLGKVKLGEECRHSKHTTIYVVHNTVKVVKPRREVSDNNAYIPTIKNLVCRPTLPRLAVP